MHDIKAIRADPGLYDFQLTRRGLTNALGAIVKVDSRVRALQEEIDGWRARDKEIDKQGLEFRNRQAEHRALLHQAQGKDEFQDNEPLSSRLNEGTQQLIVEMHSQTKAKELTKIVIPALIELERQAIADRATLLSTLPNLADDSVPNGVDNNGNVRVRSRGLPPTFAFTPVEHDVLALRLGYDPDAAASIAGARFAVLKGPLARLHRALGQYMIDVHTAEHGYTEVAPPLLVREAAVYGVGQLPKFEEDLFKTTDGRYLISTSEVVLANLVREQIVDLATLPLRFTALTPCFRSEAGSAGRDTRGLIRQHQFDKVELVSIVAPEAAGAEHERMTACAETILDRLGLAYRRMLLCAGDMGFAARKTYDLEVWLPGQGQYREISSCSDCGDFQARRMNTRYRAKGEKGSRGFVHTLNGSALAVGRTLVAVLENYQRADGSVHVPDVLHPYMGGVTELKPHG